MSNDDAAGELSYLADGVRTLIDEALTRVLDDEDGEEFANSFMFALAMFASIDGHSIAWDGGDFIIEMGRLDGHVTIELVPTSEAGIAFVAAWERFMTANGMAGRAHPTVGAQIPVDSTPHVFTDVELSQFSSVRRVPDDDAS